jgi:hypothetical protein
VASATIANPEQHIQHLLGGHVRSIGLRWDAVIFADL